MKNKVLIIITFLLIVVGLGVFLISSWYNNAITKPNGDSEDEVVFEVKQGEGIEVITENLINEGLLENKTAFQVYSKLNSDLASGIQAGYFDIAPSNSIEEIMQILQKARTLNDIKVSIPEGLRYDEIAKILADEFKKYPEAKFSLSEFLIIAEGPDAVEFSDNVQTYLDKYKPTGKSLEGYLYPDTYFFKKDTSTQAVVEKLLLTLFEEKLTEENYAEIESGNYSLYEVLNIAAMLERETITEEEQPYVADIIIKRLEQGVDGVKLLQIDATLLYIAKDWKADAFSLKTSESPYNTYKFVGLPPTPIANPGISTIDAVLNPVANDYFYYIHDNSGQVHYGKNLSEHNENVRKYL